MSLYTYIKIPPGKGKFYLHKKILLLRLKKASPFFMVGIGLIFLSVLVQSLFSYKFLVLKKTREKILAPISEIAVAEAQGFMNPLVAGVFTPKGTATDNQELDYNLINNWFPTAPLPQIKPSKITHYTLSVPEVKIDKAIVEIGGREVKKTLVQYPGTALPGEYGNTVIFGHSILPIFYNPKDYKSIFSLIPTLEKGDEIYISFDGIEFIYEVIAYQEVKPEEINVLEQRFDRQTLSLITCVPPGTYLKRGIITARLVRY